MIVAYSAIVGQSFLILRQVLRHGVLEGQDAEDIVDRQDVAEEVEECGRRRCGGDSGVVQY